MIFSIDEAEENFEKLLAMALNGETVLISKGNELFKLEPVSETVNSGKVYMAEDFLIN